ncbi:hypothetical protein F5Y03DRAFT_188724 [Xylaria venustula]|nr:hypothetical protein F5Y03DRAFT_188724 [Xylaria venustula]
MHPNVYGWPSSFVMGGIKMDLALIFFFFLLLPLLLLLYFPAYRVTALLGGILLSLSVTTICMTSTTSRPPLHDSFPYGSSASISNTYTSSPHPCRSSSILLQDPSDSRSPVQSQDFNISSPRVNQQRLLSTITCQPPAGLVSQVLIADSLVHGQTCSLSYRLSEPIIRAIALPLRLLRLRSRGASRE